jgi:hypothetical protein
MSHFAFPPAVAAALDRLTVPSLPVGFTDRLAARIDADDFPADRGLPLPAKPRLSFIRKAGWRRTGGIITSLAALGIATATAAASGVFGEPVYVPVVSDALAKADLVEIPKQVKPVVKVAPKTVAVAQKPEAPEPVVDGKTAARNLIQSKWQDPNFRKLPQDQRQGAMQAEIKAAIEAGRFTREDFRAALVEAQTERRARNEAQSKQDLSKFDEIKRKRKERAAANRARYEQASPEQKAVMRDQYRQVAQLERRLRELRAQIRDIDPADKPTIRKEMQTIRQELITLRSQNDILLSGGNPEAGR